MTEIGCDLFVDVHGDEELPHIFFAGSQVTLVRYSVQPWVATVTQGERHSFDGVCHQGISGWNDRLAELYRVFATSQLRACPAFQLMHGYGNEEIGEANMAICSDHMADQFDCLAVTLEMPYKDTLELREPAQGWSAPRCEKLGASMLEAVPTPANIYVIALRFNWAVAPF